MRVRVLWDRVLVKPIIAEQTTPGGIVLPQSVAAEKDMLTGTVVEVGHGKEREDGSIRPVVVAIGDVVAYQKDAGIEVEVLHVKHRLISEQQVLYVVVD